MFVEDVSEHVPVPAAQLASAAVVNPLWIGLRASVTQPSMLTVPAAGIVHSGGS
jgi:hypothetical protein